MRKINSTIEKLEVSRECIPEKGEAGNHRLDHRR